MISKSCLCSARKSRADPSEPLTCTNIVLKKNQGYPFPNDKFQILPNRKSVLMTI